MAHNIIRRDRVLKLYHQAITSGASHEAACETVGASVGLDPATVAWVVTEQTEEQRTS
jgi:hypothetical protein